MNTKDILIQNIREWVKLDNEIRALKKEENLRKKEKKELSNSLMEIMKEHEIDCVDLKDGQLCYTQKSVKKPITKKNLFDILSKYYKGDTNKANNLNEFILDNREETIKESISRKIDK
jgi:hypothetical protein|tara:strand:- start:195 stop:548 length:354 start_codon:yes stop_codon:yes gene_type:complete